MNKTFRWVLAVATILIALALIFIVPRLGNDQESSQVGGSAASGADKQPAESQLVIGESDAPKTIVEYGDYKCPNCTRFQTGSYQDLKSDYLDTGKAKLVFRNLPYIAEDSRTAAEGSYCANEQGLFEEYHEAVYNYVANLYATKGLSQESENVLTDEVLTGMVADADGDGGKFSACLKNKKYHRQVEKDLKSSEKDDVSGTPTFFIAGQKIVSAQPISTFRTLLEAN